MAKTPAPTPSRSTPRASGKRIQVRRSGVHGKGVFALQDIAEGETVIEYVGEIISWDEAQDRHPHDPSDPNHTFYFHVNEDRVIDALHGGNSSRWINHSCDANCEADEENDRIFIKAIRNISAGEELNYDYGLIIDEPYTKKLKAEYPCWCGSANCRGTLLSPKRRPATPKTPAQKKTKVKDKSKGKAKPEAKVKADANNKKTKAIKPLKQAEKPQKAGKRSQAAVKHP
ncbi:SET domain-containing protein-lysine N-methyltransferase [Limnohabitans sp. 2KL-1]|uniref:SET domain-containing protein n=1 Tax=Limnohabitans sp. 2KL-1 TaxID=1100699 RepID=UPI000D36037A|nr:SET domain-containing protein-lysine N-methyltransferase [Limnohabitans sp. 2KL-1]PUE50639.1 SET domain-containing protein-lysine N-methyltransferase [Limnohabitans sp. 2KL-1]